MAAGKGKILVPDPAGGAGRLSSLGTWVKDNYAQPFTWVQGTRAYTWSKAALTYFGHKIGNALLNPAFIGATIGLETGVIVTQLQENGDKVKQYVQDNPTICELAITSSVISGLLLRCFAEIAGVMPGDVGVSPSISVGLLGPTACTLGHYFNNTTTYISSATPSWLVCTDNSTSMFCGAKAQLAEFEYNNTMVGPAIFAGAITVGVIGNVVVGGVGVACVAVGVVGVAVGMLLTDITQVSDFVEYVANHTGDYVTGYNNYVVGVTSNVSDVNETA